jgi:virginiamycin B lyase
MLLFAAAAVPLVAFPAVSAAGPLHPDSGAAVCVTEWRVPWERSRPRDPYVDRTGRVWFVGQAGNYVAYLDPQTGRFKRYEIEEGTHPHNLIIDARGFVWYTGNANGRIGRLDPATGAIRKYPMPDPAARDPHTLAFGRNGDLWFTVQGGNFIGHLTTPTGRVQLLHVPTANARPYGIVVDPQGRPWVAEFGTNKIATVDPATFALREFTLPNRNTRPRRIALTSDGAIWYGDYTRGFLGRLDPATGQVEEWANPAGPRSLPYAMTVDDRDRLWLVETGVQPNRLVGFDPRTRQFFGITEIRESGGGTVRHMTFNRPTREIWFGTDANTIGRARVDQAAGGTSGRDCGSHVAVRAER